mmetsp:Transcript_9428/g.9758  ORF Transcript_9428/g.9758 Transcript_9428/m.9758 type:complete len:158 (+) Transcript_9428:2-475(+)
MNEKYDNNNDPKEIEVDVKKDQFHVDESNVKKSDSSNIAQKHYYGEVNHIGGQTSEFHDHHELDHDLNVQEHEEFIIPQNLKKTFYMTMFLFCLGAILIGLGFIEEIKEHAFGVSVSMWTLGGIAFIPGGYYAYKFYQAYKSQGEEREDILAQIPEI